MLAGVNGAGKSSIGGETIRAFGADFYNPDETARALVTAGPSLGQMQANALAWQQGRQLIERAIAQRLDFAFETTLGGGTIARLLANPARGVALEPSMLLQMMRARIVAPADLSRTPDWAKTIVAAALQHHPRPIGGVRASPK